MSSTNVRFLAFGRFNEDTLITSFSNEPKFSDNFQKEALNILKKLNLLNLRPEERQKIKTANGAWFCRVSQNQIAIIVLCGEDYPERHAYTMLQDAQAELEKIPNFQTVTRANITKSLNKPLETIIKKYSDLSSIDGLAQANNTVNQIQNTMSKNIEQQIKNMAKLEETQKKSALLKDSSGIFLDNSVEMRKIQQERLMRMRIMIGVVILIVLLILYKAFF